MSYPSALARPTLRGLLIDLSGNLHVGSNPTPNAVEALQRLQKAGIPFRLCSNTSKESTGAVIQRLNQMGFDIPAVTSVSKQCDHGQSPNSPGHSEGCRLVWTSIGAVARLLQSLNVTK